MKNKTPPFVLALGLAVGVVISLPAGAVLLDRGANMVYDDVLDITWTRQAGDGVSRTWDAAVAWADTLVFEGFDDWRLPWASVAAGVGPITTPPGGFPCTGLGGADEVACRDIEMAYMFYYNLGGTQGGSKTGNRTALGGEELTGIQSVYWSRTEFNPTSSAWFFNFNDGFQGPDGKHVSYAAWAVRQGDVLAVPEPATWLLLGAGLVGLGWRRGRGWPRR